MSENINFISAVDLPEAEGNDLKFLCLENGEMKQKDTAGMGLDVDVFANITVLSRDDDDWSIELTVSDEKVPSYAKLKEMLLSGRTPKCGGLVTVVPWEELGSSHFYAIQSSCGAFALAEAGDDFPETIYASLWVDFEIAVAITPDNSVEWVVLW